MLGGDCCRAQEKERKMRELEKHRLKRFERRCFLVQ